MDRSYILPFIDSVQNVFEMMLQLPVNVGQPELKSGGDPTHDVSGLIGMGGDVEGTICLSFPSETAQRVVSLFTGMELTINDEDFADAVGELVNMVSGGAKAKFEGKRVDISCPSVVIGPKHSVFGRKDVVCIMIPCETDAGCFNVEVAIRQSCLTSAQKPATEAA